MPARKPQLGATREIL